MPRPTWDEYFLEVMKSVAARATCDRGRNGSVIVKEKRILSTGYVGAPSGLPHCDEIGHLLKKVTHEDGRESMHCLRTAHAELNAITQAAKFGVSIEGSTIYSKMEPCSACAMAIINSGIKRVVCEMQYHAAQETRDMFKQAGIELVVINNKIQEYEKQ